MKILIITRDALWGMPTVVLLSAFGLYFTARTRIFNPALWLKALHKPRDKKKDGISALAALSTALGGTVGVGSISGVALSISLGGAGSIFWMWVCSFLGMGLKYAEVSLAHKHRVKNGDVYRGGAMYCLKAKGCPRLAVFFALLTVAAAVCGGSLVQAEAMSDALQGAFKSKALIAFTVAAVTFLIIQGGRELITRLNTIALPIISVLFVIVCLIILFSNLYALRAVFARIFEEAFGLKQAAAGVSGATMIAVGCTRGTFSHEAGMGSSPISYSAGAETDSHTQGLWGVTEVFIDSFVVSTLVALCLLCTRTESVYDLFSFTFGSFGEVFYIVAICVFAFAAIISWSFYGEEALYFLCRGKKSAFLLFHTGVAVCALAGALMTENGAFAAADIWGALMLFPNLYLLFKSRSDIIALAK